MIAGVFECPAAVLAWLYAAHRQLRDRDRADRRDRDGVGHPADPEEHQGHARDAAAGAGDAPLQAEHRDDRQKLNEEMMKLYQEHKVNPMASCLPLVAQMPVFIIMFRDPARLTYEPVGGNKLDRPGGPQRRRRHRATDRVRAPLRVEEFGALPVAGPAEPHGLRSGSTCPCHRPRCSAQNFARGLIYAGLVVILGLLYFFQQRMVAARAAVSPTMSPASRS